jgi:hypothetical protein
MGGAAERILRRHWKGVSDIAAIQRGEKVVTVRVFRCKAGRVVDEPDPISVTDGENFERRCGELAFRLRPKKDDEYYEFVRVADAA